MISYRIVVLVATLCFGFALGTWLVARTPDKSSLEVVSWIVDGDTIYVESSDLSIRLRGVDAPELGSPDGELVKWELIDHLYGEVVSLSCEDALDKYGRRLCDVHHDGHDVGEWLLARGFARKWVD